MKNFVWWVKATVCVFILLASAWLYAAFLPENSDTHVVFGLFALVVVGFAGLFFRGGGDSSSKAWGWSCFLFVCAAYFAVAVPLAVWAGKWWLVLPFLMVLDAEYLLLGRRISARWEWSAVIVMIFFEILAAVILFALYGVGLLG